MFHKGEGGTTKCYKQYLAGANSLPKWSNETVYKHESVFVYKMLYSVNGFIMMLMTVAATIKTLGNLCGSDKVMAKEPQERTHYMLCGWRMHKKRQRGLCWRSSGPLLRFQISWFQYLPLVRLASCWRLQPLMVKHVLLLRLLKKRARAAEPPSRVE